MECQNAILSVIFMFLTSNATVYYIDPAGGNDVWSGTSTNTPFQTWEAVTDRGLWQAGNTILQKRGTTARLTDGIEINNVTGTSGSPLRIGSYGTDEQLPVILGSRDFSNTNDWTFLGNNQWGTTETNIADAGRDACVNMFGEEKQENVGNRVWSTNELQSAQDFYWDTTNKRVITYCIENPATYFGHIESCSHDIIKITGSAYVDIEDIYFKYAPSMAVGAYYSDNIHIRNCSASWGGGTVITAGRGGNAFGFYNGVQNSSVTGCYMSQWWDWGVCVEHWSSAGNNYVSTNNMFANNVIERCGGGIEVAHMVQVIDGLISDTSIINNVINDTGYGWAGHVNNVKGKGIACLAMDVAPVTSTHIASNTVDRFTSSGIKVQDVENSIVERNIIRNGDGTGDAVATALLIHGGGYLESTRESTGLFCYNLIYNNQARGLYIANNTPLSGDVEIYNNTFFNNGIVTNISPWVWANIYISGDVSRINFRNNISYSSGTYALSLASSSGTRFLSLDNNVYYREGTNAAIRYVSTDYSQIASYIAAVGSGYESHSMITNPCFVYPETGDFSLQSGSCCIDAGADLGFTEDFCGNPIRDIPDIGAFEYWP